MAYRLYWKYLFQFEHNTYVEILFIYLFLVLLQAARHYEIFVFNHLNYVYIIWFRGQVVILNINNSVRVKLNANKLLIVYNRVIKILSNIVVIVILYTFIYEIDNLHGNLFLNVYMLYTSYILLFIKTIDLSTNNLQSKKLIQ